MAGRADGRPVVVIGAGGHAKVVIECLRHQGWNVVGCTDADPSPRDCAGAPVLGSDELLPKLKAEGVGHAFCALGGNALRERIYRSLIAQGFELPVVIGPGANASPSARIGPGSILMPGASVNVESVIGAAVIINTNASVDHDARLSDAVHIGPGAALAGEVTVGARTFVATGSAVIPRITIGHDVIIGAGSVVIRDIGDNLIAYGNPARARNEPSQAES